MQRTAIRILHPALVLAAALAFAAGPVVADGGQTFKTPEEAIEALVTATKHADSKQVLHVLGPDAKTLVESGDQVATEARYADFTKQYEEKHSIDTSAKNKAVLQIGADEWPFPIPVIKASSGWHFDTKAGREELLNRQIGRNELAAMEVTKAYVDAQQDYYLRNPDHDPLLHYAQKIASSPNAHDGLYWEVKEGEPPSPLGPLVAQARIEGYGKKAKPAESPVPYHGYYYRILTGQGPNAKGGAYDYIAHDKMIGGFGLVAYPASYGVSGVMTFIVNHDGVVYQKDLGSKTAKLAGEMTKFDTGGGWRPAAE